MGTYKVYFAQKHTTSDRLDAFCEMCVSFVSRSYRHVAVGDGEIVLNPVLRGNEFWADELWDYPGLAGWFEVPAKVPLSTFDMIGPRKRWHYFARYLTGWAARGPHTDCVTTACTAIGCPVLGTPDELWDYLRREGHDWHEMGRFRDRGVGTVCGSAEGEVPAAADQRPEPTGE